MVSAEKADDNKGWFSGWFGSKSAPQPRGTRYQVHDPGTWPAQADLVRHGRWEDFKVLTDRLDGGREPDA